MSKYRKLKGFAYNIAHKFTISANHFVFMALQGAAEKVHIDLFSGKIEQQEYRKERNQILVQSCTDNFWQLMNENGFKNIQGAGLEAVFDTTNKKLQKDVILVPAEIKVQIVDDRGRKHIGIYKEDIIAQ